jgi:hypothetical protein
MILLLAHCGSVCLPACKTATAPVVTVPVAQSLVYAHHPSVRTNITNVLLLIPGVLMHSSVLSASSTKLKTATQVVYSGAQQTFHCL